MGKLKFTAARAGAYVFALGLLLTCLPQSASSQQDMKAQIERGREMLATIKKDIAQHYFDPNFHGLNLEAHFAEADAQVAAAVSGDQIYGIIARALLAFEDSHTYFIPPRWSIEVEYGWQMQMFGDKCYVTSVAPDSDAAAKGLKPGDQILSIFDVPVTRETLRPIQYLFYQLRPLKAMLVTLQAPGGKPQRVELLTRWKNLPRPDLVVPEVRRDYSVQRYWEMGDDLTVWRMPDFELSPEGVDEMMKKAGRRGALILDLRGNGGGYQHILEYLVGHFFDHDVKIGERKGRRESYLVVAKPQGEKPYQGKLVVLVDSSSASAAELFARTVQLEKRGTVVGDRTAGAVTAAHHYSHTYIRNKNNISAMQVVDYGVSVTISNFVMPDGKSLERVGVTPDETLLPTPADLRAGTDTQLLRAAELLGVKLNLKKPKEVRFD